MRAFAGLVVLVAASGCLPELPPLDFRGERVVVGSEVVEQVCGGTVARLDREVVEIERRLELGPASKPLRVFIVTHETVAGYCKDAGSCVDHFALREPFVLLNYNMFERASAHELIHARLGDTHSVRLLEEGVAEAVSPPSCPNTVPDTLVSTELLEARKSPELSDLGGYYVSGEFVAWLLDEFGPDAFLTFYASVRRKSSPDTIRAKYREQFNREIDDDLFAHVRTRDDLDALPPEHFGCLAPPAPEHDGVISLSANLDCDSERVHNEFDVDGGGYVEWTLTLEHPQKFELVGTLPEWTSLTLQVCGCVPPKGGPQRLLPRTFKERENIAPGTYRLRWSGALDPGLTLDVELVPTI